ncbi:hypothetical protein V6N13_025908 [Hibiscus sabdariffa]
MHGSMKTKAEARGSGPGLNSLTNDTTTYPLKPIGYKGQDRQNLCSSNSWPFAYCQTIGCPFSPTISIGTESGLNYEKRVD